jgi:hypothetical protein
VTTRTLKVITEGKERPMDQTQYFKGKEGKRLYHFCPHTEWGYVAQTELQVCLGDVILRGD